ncbi:MAG: hypothetical protein JW878_02645 [Methanomicrobia archaeon]|nr:hypothetical protein [Methanomicrobia archaeon]
MAFLKRMNFGRKGRENSSLTPEPGQDAGDERVMEETEDVGIFDDLDAEKVLVEEWWLQRGVEEAVEEIPVDGEGATIEGEKSDEDELIYGLKGAANVEDDDDDLVLKKALEELGDVNSDELLELGRTALSEMGAGG